MGDRVSRPKPQQQYEPIRPVLRPIMAEQSSKEPAPSTIIVVMGASVSKTRLHAPKFSSSLLKSGGLTVNKLLVVALCFGQSACIDVLEPSVNLCT